MSNLMLKALDKVNEDLVKMPKEERQKLSGQARKFALAHNFTKISLTDSHIRVIITALNVFYRMRSGSTMLEIY